MKFFDRGPKPPVLKRAETQKVEKPARQQAAADIRRTDRVVATLDKTLLQVETKGAQEGVDLGPEEAEFAQLRLEQYSLAGDTNAALSAVNRDGKVVQLDAKRGQNQKLPAAGGQATVRTGEAQIPVPNIEKQQQIHALARSVLNICGKREQWRNVVTHDKDWIRLHNGQTVVDIGTTPFKKLPRDIKVRAEKFAEAIYNATETVLKTEGMDHRSQGFINQVERMADQFQGQLQILPGESKGEFFLWNTDRKSVGSLFKENEGGIVRSAVLVMQDRQRVGSPINVPVQHEPTVPSQPYYDGGTDLDIAAG